MSRAGFLVLHRRIALVFAPLLLIQALTGSVLLFRAPLARAIDPAAMTRHDPGTAPISTLLTNVQASFPELRVTRIFLPASSSDVALAELAGGTRYVSLDPGSGRFLASGSAWRFPLEAALQLHYRLMDGRIGLAVILANAVALTLLALTGLRFWWPGPGRFAKSLAIRSAAPGRLRLRQYHRTGGVLGAVLILFSSTTGVLLVVPDLIETAGPSAPVPPRTGAQIERAVKSAALRFPGSAMRDIRFPAADRIDVNFSAPERNPRAVHVVSVRLSDGTVTKSLAARDNPVLWMKILAFHTGESFGLPGRLLLLAEAVLIAALALTGPWMWWQARRMRGRK